MRFSRGNAGNAETADDFCKINYRVIGFFIGKKGERNGKICIWFVENTVDAGRVGDCHRRTGTPE